MKRYNLYITFLLGFFLFMAACTDEENAKRSLVEEGVPVTATLKFAPEESAKIETRSAITDKAENAVTDLFIFVFRQNGNTSQWEREGEVHRFTYDSQESGNIELETTSGTKRIYAIANATENPLLDITENEITSVKNIVELKQLSSRMKDATIERTQGHLLMSGWFVPSEGSDEEGQVIIATNGKVSSGEIKLVRLDSRITFKVSAQNNNGRTITFTPKQWRVVNVPQASNIFEKEYNLGNEDAVTSVERDYFSSEPVNFNETDIDSDGHYKGGSFTFYMLENRKAAKDEIKTYEQRELQVKNPDGTTSDGDKKVTNGDYVYADKYATYVELSGSYFETYYEGGEKKERSAEVRYTIHLGYVDDKPEDFKSERNCKYTYNVTIEGVDNIKLEVTTSKNDTPTENQPGAEGDIVESQEFFYVDAHYETKLITFNKNKVSPDATFRVKTSYETDGRGEKARDYKWVWFVQNEKEQEQTVETEGHYEYSDFVEHSWHGEYGWKKGKWDFYYYNFYKKRDWVEPVITYGGYKYKTDFISFPQDESKRLTVAEVIQLLQTEKDKVVDGTSIYDTQGNAVFTVFIDEFYYDEDPIKKIPASWKDFVNVPNREMHILCDTEYSQDQESSLTTSSFLISQRSIKTIYNPDVVSSAWGIETIREGETLGSSGKSGNTATNGRYNMYSYMNWTNDAWSTWIKTSDNTMQSDYNKVDYACLQRNRDLNGDGYISDDEVRWYLPTVDQLTGIWIGKDGLPTEAYLYKGDPDKTAENHFMNSSNVMFWAEEGSSTGHNGSGKFNYRCARNLGQYDRSTPKAEEEPDNYIVKPISNNIIDLSRMNTNSLRSDFVSSGELTVTDELNQANRPYTKFKVATSLTSNSISYSGVNNLITTPCASKTEDGGGWRMPNQRELSLIVANLYKNKSMSRTISSLSNKKVTNQKIPVVYMSLPGGIITLDATAGDISASVRCVKDVR